MPAKKPTRTPDPVVFTVKGGPVERVAYLLPTHLRGLIRVPDTHVNLKEQLTKNTYSRVLNTLRTGVVSGGYRSASAQIAAPLLENAGLPIIRNGYYGGGFAISGLDRIGMTYAAARKFTEELDMFAKTVALTRERPQGKISILAGATVVDNTVWEKTPATYRSIAVQLFDASYDDKDDPRSTKMFMNYLDEHFWPLVGRHPREVFAAYL